MLFKLKHQKTFVKSLVYFFSYLLSLNSSSDIEKYDLQTSHASTKVTTATELVQRLYIQNHYFSSWYLSVIRKTRKSTVQISQDHKWFD